jgi:hypothetical protein
MKVGNLNFSLAEAVMELCKYLEKADPQVLDASFVPDEAEKARLQEPEAEPVTYRDLMLTTLEEAGVNVKCDKEVRIIPTWKVGDGGP